MRRLLLFALLLPLSGCVSEDESPPAAPAIDPQRVLLRASLDLTGARPSPEALKRVTEDPTKLAAEVDELMDEDGFGLRVRDFFAVSYRTRSSRNYPLGFGDARTLVEYAEAPLKYYEEAAVDDLPLTHVLTAGHAFVAPSIAQYEPVTGYDYAAGGWQRVPYSDGRPAAGVLSSNELWIRYVTSDANHNRARANAVSRILLCDNYLKRPVDFPRDIDLTDASAIENAISVNQGCQACHASLDPIAAHFGVFEFEPLNDPSALLYNESGSASTVPAVPPMYFGRPTNGLADLARLISEDPRFARCAVQRVYEGLMGRPITRNDFDAVSRHEEVFRGSGLRLKALFRSIVLDPVYSGVSDGARQGLARKRMTPEVYELAVESLTGFRGMIDSAGSDGNNEPFAISMLRDDVDGLHVLAGGLDARAGDHAPQYPNPSEVMVHRYVASEAAQAAADNGRLGEFVGPAWDGSSFDAEAARRLLSAIFANASDSDLADTETLWNALVSAGDSPQAAWQGVLAAFLRDASFVTY